MLNQKLFVSSHAPYWHNGSSLSGKSYNIMLAALPAVIMGIFQYGTPALAEPGGDGVLAHAAGPREHEYPLQVGRCAIM